jgi:hypothetical protein
MNRAIASRLVKLEARRGSHDLTKLSDEELVRALAMTRQLIERTPKDMQELAELLGWTLKETAKINCALIEEARRLGLLNGQMGGHE